MHLHSALCTACALALALLAAAVPAAADPGLIAFSSNQYGGVWEIWAMHPDGTGQVRLTDNATGAEDPAWSPDGTRIAYTAGLYLRTEIWVVNANGTGEICLTDTREDESEPAWSPDGGRIAFARNNDLWVMDADGSDQSCLAATPGSSEVAPAWSPDGSLIAYLNMSSSVRGEIWVMSANGTGRGRLAAAAGYETDPDGPYWPPGGPCWSPDGARIAYVHRNYYSGKGDGIHAVNADGSGGTWVTEDPSDRNPTWSPDGTRIVFESGGDLYAINPDRTGRTAIAADAAWERQPAWGVASPVAPSIDLEMDISVDGGATWLDADAGPGPALFPFDTPPQFQFTVTNTGDTRLENLSVTHDAGGPVPLGVTTLMPGASTATVTNASWFPGQQVDTSTATARWMGTVVADPDTVAFFGLVPEPGIALDVLTDGDEADAPPGPSIVVGTRLNWTFVVTNTGNLALTEIGVRYVVDREGFPLPPSPAYRSGDTGGDGVLDPGEAWVYEAGATAAIGPHEIAGMVLARPTPRSGLEDVRAPDLAHYTGVEPPPPSPLRVELQVSADAGSTWHDADAPPGPYVPVGRAPRYRLRAWNDGDVFVTNLTFGGTLGSGPFAPVLPPRSPAPPPSRDFSGSWHGGPQSAASTVTGTYGDRNVTGTDAAYWFGAVPLLSLGLKANGDDAGAPPGPAIAVGTPVTWTYTLANPGNVALDGVVVADPAGGTLWGPAALAPGETVLVERTETAAPGPHEQTATASGTPPGGLPAVSATAQGHYDGTSPPVVEAGADLTGTTGMPVAFSGAYTDEGDSGAHTIAWDFGDGDMASGTLNASHTYARNGTFTATLVVTDAGGLAGVDSLNVTVLDPPPIGGSKAYYLVSTTPAGAQVFLCYISGDFALTGNTSAGPLNVTVFLTGTPVTGIMANLTGYADAVYPIVSYPPAYQTVPVNLTLAPAVLAVPPSTLLPTDTDGDEKYDDVNGNGRKDFNDVVLFFNQILWIAANGPISAFDYNGNGHIDFADVIWLFNNL